MKRAGGLLFAVLFLAVFAVPATAGNYGGKRVNHHSPPPRERSQRPPASSPKQTTNVNVYAPSTSTATGGTAESASTATSTSASESASNASIGGIAITREREFPQPPAIPYNQPLTPPAGTGAGGNYARWATEPFLAHISPLYRQYGKLCPRVFEGDTPPGHIRPLRGEGDSGLTKISFEWHANYFTYASDKPGSVEIREVEGALEKGQYRYLCLGFVSVFVPLKYAPEVTPEALDSDMELFARMRLGTKGFRIMLVEFPQYASFNPGNESTGSSAGVAPGLTRALGTLTLGAVGGNINRSSGVTAATVQPGKAYIVVAVSAGKHIPPNAAFIDLADIK